MHKTAFIPITPFKVKDKDEYYSETGVMKRNTNRSLSMITGATAGALAGMAIGTLAGQMLGKKHPGLFDGNVERYLDTAKKTGFHPAKQFIESYIREHGMKPTKIPVELHAPIAGLVFGSVAGALPAEHMAMRRMEKKVGIEPTTAKEYLKKEVTPYAAGATASLIASDALYQLSGKYPKLLSGSINESTIPVMSGAVYAAAKNIAKNVMDGKRKGEGDKEMVIRQKLAALAIYGDQRVEKTARHRSLIGIHTESGKRKSREDAKYLREMSEMQSRRKGEVGERFKEDPLGSVYIGGVGGDYVNSSLGSYIDLIKARKAAYRAEKPGKSIIPFTGWGAKGQEALDKIPRGGGK